MYYHLIPVPVYIILIYFYWRARNRGDLKLTAVVQPVLTFLGLVITALSFLSPKADPTYTTWILVGMGLCFLADIFNIDMNNNKILYAAIAVFVVAYMTYAVTFTRFSGFRWQDWIVGALFLLLYAFLMRLYWKKLGAFRLAVLIYGLVMPFMVTRAISTLYGGIFPLVPALLVTIGCSLLFLGDIEYGMHRFYRERKVFFGPFCYAGGQLLIALSVSYFLLH